MILGLGLTLGCALLTNAGFLLRHRGGGGRTASRWSPSTSQRQGLFGFQLGRRQWIGLAVTATGLAALAVTGGPAGDAGRSSSPSTYSSARSPQIGPALAVIAFTSVAANLIAISAASSSSTTRSVPGQHRSSDAC